jgi:hypothetical protein
MAFPSGSCRSAQRELPFSSRLADVLVRFSRQRREQALCEWLRLLG